MNRVQRSRAACEFGCPAAGGITRAGRLVKCAPSRLPYVTILPARSL